MIPVLRPDGEITRKLCSIVEQTLPKIAGEGRITAWPLIISVFEVKIATHKCATQFKRQTHTQGIRIKGA